MNRSPCNPRHSPQFYSPNLSVMRCIRMKKSMHLLNESLLSKIRCVVKDASPDSILPHIDQERVVQTAAAMLFTASLSVFGLKTAELPFGRIQVPGLRKFRIRSRMRMSNRIWTFCCRPLPRFPAGRNCSAPARRSCFPPRRNMSEASFRGFRKRAAVSVLFCWI